MDAMMDATATGTPHSATGTPHAATGTPHAATGTPHAAAAPAQSAAATVRALASHDAATALRAVRTIKNQIIGNRHKKSVYIAAGALPAIVAQLQSDAARAVRVHAAAALASFSYQLDEGMEALVQAGGVDALLAMLQSDDATTVQATVRALRLVFQVRACPVLFLGLSATDHATDRRRSHGAGCRACATPRLLCALVFQVPLYFRCARVPYSDKGGC